MSCVRPGVLLTKARRRLPARALIALDLPALERPAKASSGIPGGGSSRGSWTEIAYAASRSATVKSLLFPLFPLSFSRGARMRVAVALFGLMALVYARAVGAAAPEAPAQPDVERGKQIAATVCAACHGPDGNSPAPAN